MNLRLRLRIRARKGGRKRPVSASVADLQKGEEGTLDRIDLPEDRLDDPAEDGIGNITVHGTLSGVQNLILIS